MARTLLQRLIRNWAYSTGLNQPQGTPRTIRRDTLRLEELENRITPSTLQLKPLSLLADVAGQSYSAQYSATGGSGHYVFSLASGALPAGLSLNANTGVLSGDATVAGAFNFTVKATDSVTPSLTATEAGSLSVTPAAASAFAVSAPATVTAGVAFNVTITAKDAYGNVVTNYGSSLMVSLSDGQAIHATSNALTWNKGVATINFSLDTADSLTLTASWGAVKGVSSKFTVAPAAVASFVVSAPSTATAGTGVVTTITAKDQFGNVLTNYTGSVSFTTSDGQTVKASSIAWNKGVGTVTLTFNKADSFTIAAAAGTMKGTSGTIAVSPAAVASFVVNAPSTATAGTAATVTVTAEDQFGNVVTGYTGAVTFSASDSQTVSAAAISWNKGVGTVSLTLDKADSLTLTATAGSIKGTSGSVVVNPGALASFVVTAPASATVGSGSTVTVTAKDAYGNVITNYTGAVTFTASDSQTLTATTVAWNKGVGTATVTYSKADTLTVAAAVGSVKGTSASVVVSGVTPPASGDWFSQNMPDATLAALARADFARDHTLTYSDILGLFAQAESEGTTLTANELTSLQALVTSGGVAALSLTPDVVSLTYKVVDGDPANSVIASGNVKVGSTTAQLQTLVSDWFLGAAHPTIDMTDLQGYNVGYTLVNGSLFGTGGPSAQDVYQGAEGDCWLLASFGVTAANDSSVIKSMFTDDGVTTENGVQVHVWTVRFYENGVATYLTVDNYLPTLTDYGDYAFAGGYQSTSSYTTLWVELLEKAYAQLSASGWDQRPQADAYSSLDGGLAQTVLPALTGKAESSDAYTSAGVIAALGKGELLTVGSMNDVPSLGIIGGHDYMLLSYNSANGTFKLGNPWGINGTYDYNGFTAYGTLNLTWAQLQSYFYLDGDDATAAAATFDASSTAGAQAHATTDASATDSAAAELGKQLAVVASDAVGTQTPTATVRNMDAVWVNFQAPSTAQDVTPQTALLLAATDAANDWALFATEDFSEDFLRA